jgi:DNA (cytosine-5)-methyltransferase 1
MNELALFAGAGGGILGGHLLGWRTVCAVEWEPYPASVLVARQNDGILPPFPIWDDVQTFDGKPWQGIVDVVSGGFPCQDISSAGGGAGITGSRSSMWKHMARIIGEVRPQYAFIENSPMLTIRGLETVLCDLAALGFNARWGVVSAADVGAPHLRERIWIVANNHSNSKSTQSINAKQICKPNMANTNSAYGKGNKCTKRGVKERADTSKPLWWASEPAVGRVANGVAARMDRLKAIGNGQVPRVAETAWRLLK